MTVQRRFLALTVSTVVAAAGSANAQGFQAQGQQAQGQQAQRQQAQRQRQRLQQQRQRQLQQPRRVVATVNGDPITQREVDITVRRQLMQIQGENRQPPGPEAAQRIAPKAVESLIESRLVEQYAAQQGPGVKAEEVNASIERLKEQLSAQGGSFERFLASRGQTEETFKDRIKGSIAWHKFQQEQVTEEKLNQFFQENQGRFNAQSFDQARQEVTNAYVEKIWDEIVAETKPEAEIRMAERGAGGQPSTAIPQSR